MNPITQDNAPAEREPGLEQYHSTNSSIACRYPRWASAEVRLFRTADFACSKSGNRRTVLGLRRVRFEEGLRGIVRGPPKPRYDALLTSATLRFARHSPGISGDRRAESPDSQSWTSVV